MSDPEDTALPFDGNRTVIQSAVGSEIGPVHVIWRSAGKNHRLSFVNDFTLGRHSECDVCIREAADVSRTHARVYLADGLWHVEDLNSANGTFLDSVRVQEAVLPAKSSLELGRNGAKVRFEVPGASETFSAKDVAERYFGKRSDQEFGYRTVAIRNAFVEVDRKKTRRYQGIIAGIAVLAILAIGLVSYQYQQLQRTRSLATEIFYSMKTVQVQMAQIEDAVRESGDADLINMANRRRDEVAALETQYNQFLEELDVFSPDLSQEDRLILRVARMLGECELAMPEEFKAEVKTYIRKWQRSARLRNSIARLEAKGLVDPIASAMLEQHLPPQFLYLGLQESGFKDRSIGPKTRFGIAKGMWQFIPSTARRYGLRTGPLVELSVHDPHDDRFDPILATGAAAKYLRDIYSKDAQASGLLVMASYNWGPANIRRRIQQLPDNPRDRNFWELLKNHKIPKETYNYVLFIVSAIVIGEDPAAFGFKFQNPLQDIEQRLHGAGESNPV